MNKYELAVVVSAKVEDEVRTETIEKVKGIVERFGGTITNVEEAGKKRLAEASVPAQVEELMRITDNVIRYLCTRQEA